METREAPGSNRGHTGFAPLIGRTVIAALALILLLPIASAQAATTAYYLGGNVGDHPQAGLATSAPTGGSLPNYDPSRDAQPGLLVQKGGSGAGESIR